MKRSTLISFIMLLAISACFFSSSVFAGGGGGVAGDEHPWESDGLVNDTSDGFTFTQLRVEARDTGNSFTLFSYSLSSRFTIWIFSENLMGTQQKQVEEITVRNTYYRGSRSTKKIMR